MEVHQTFHILFLHMFLFSLMYVFLYTNGLNIIALVIASLFEAYLYCLGLLFHIALYFNWRVCLVLVRVLVVSYSCYSIVFIFWLETIGNNPLCVALCWFLWVKIRFLFGKGYIFSF